MRHEKARLYLLRNRGEINRQEKSTTDKLVTAQDEPELSPALRQLRAPKVLA